MVAMVRAFLSLGSNLGDRLNNLKEAVNIIGRYAGVSVERVSSVYETGPVGEVEQDNFYNVVVEIRTGLTARGLLELAQIVERALKRERKIRWGPRIIDVDILLYGDVFVSEQDLVVPHPEMKNRAFVLIPLIEIAPEIKLPEDKPASVYLEVVAGQKVEKVGSLV